MSGWGLPGGNVSNLQPMVNDPFQSCCADRDDWQPLLQPVWLQGLWQHLEAPSLILQLDCLGVWCSNSTDSDLQPKVGGSN